MNDERIHAYRLETDPHKEAQPLSTYIKRSEIERVVLEVYRREREREWEEFKLGRGIADPKPGATVPEQDIPAELVYAEGAEVVIADAEKKLGELMVVLGVVLPPGELRFVSLAQAALVDFMAEHPFCEMRLDVKAGEPSLGTADWQDRVWKRRLSYIFGPKGTVPTKGVTVRGIDFDELLDDMVEAGYVSRADWTTKACREALVGALGDLVKQGSVTTEWLPDGKSFRFITGLSRGELAKAVNEA